MSPLLNFWVPYIGNAAVKEWLECGHGVVLLIFKCCASGFGEQDRGTVKFER